MSYGLNPRPELDPDELAALVAVAEELVRSESRRAPDRTPAWRFSGRWFDADPVDARRPNR